MRVDVSVRAYKIMNKFPEDFIRGVSPIWL